MSASNIISYRRSDRCVCWVFRIQHLCHNTNHGRTRDLIVDGQKHSDSTIHGYIWSILWQHVRLGFHRRALSIYELYLFFQFAILHCLSSTRLRWSKHNCNAQSTLQALASKFPGLLWRSSTHRRAILGEWIYLIANELALQLLVMADLLESSLRRVPRQSRSNTTTQVLSVVARVLEWHWQSSSRWLGVWWEWFDQGELHHYSLDSSAWLVLTNTFYFASVVSNARHTDRNSITSRTFDALKSRSWNHQRSFRHDLLQSILVFIGSLWQTQNLRDCCTECVNWYVEAPTVVVQYLNLNLSQGCVFITTSTLLYNVMLGAVCTIILAIVGVEVLGLHFIFSAKFNALSVINVAATFALGVEYISHILRIFNISDAPQRLEKTLNYVGKKKHTDPLSKIMSNDGILIGNMISMSVVSSLISVFLLLFSEFQLIQMYFGVTWFFALLFAGLHALIFIPIILSIYEEIRTK